MKPSPNQKTAHQPHLKKVGSRSKWIGCGITALMLGFTGVTMAQAADAAGVFTVAEGASPWSDRVGQWTLTNVPNNIKGAGPLPQGNCGSRSLEVPEKATSILIGVQANDAAKFTEKYAGAKDTGTEIAVKNPEGTTLPYMIFKLENPPAKLDGNGVFNAGLLLLKVESNGAAGTPPAPSATPQPSPSPQAALSGQDGAACRANSFKTKAQAQNRI